MSAVPAARKRRMEKKAFRERGTRGVAMRKGSGRSRAFADASTHF
jgi:hypothetical protein